MPELYMVHVKVPGFTSKDAVNVKFESGALVIDGKMERVASDCVVGRRLAMVGPVFIIHTNYWMVNYVPLLDLKYCTTHVLFCTKAQRQETYRSSLVL